MAVQEGNIVGIMNNGNEKIYRVLLNSYDKGTCKWSFARAEVNEYTLVSAISSGKIKIRNAKVDGKVLKGTTGSLSRFNVEGTMGFHPVVILSELRNDSGRLLGYKIATFDGKVKNVKLLDMINQCYNISEKAKKYKVNIVPIQNAIFMEAKDGVSAHIKGYEQNQFIVEEIKTSKPENAKPAVVNNADNNKQVSKLEEVFNKDQITELKLGRDRGINYKIYGNKDLSADQMREIRKALEAGLNPKPFASPAFSAKSMKAYRIQLKYGVNIKEFVHPGYSPEQIIELSTAQLNGVDVSKLADPKKSAKDMAKERIELESKLWKEIDVSVIDLINELDDDKYNN